jgi:hypothetical protein
MQILVRKLSGHLFRHEKSLVYRWRSSRMRAFLRLMNIPSGARIVDLGGSEMVWKLIEHDFHVTLVNLPGFNPEITDPSRYTRIEHDACDVRGILEDNSFDVVFSNSTIEHVGDESRQADFAREARRLAPAYWIQTPSDKFPIEIHTGVPFYFKLSEKRRRKLLDKWHRTLPVWADMIEATRVLSRGRMQELFPDGQVYIERKFGLEKSYTFYRPCS